MDAAELSTAMKPWSSTATPAGAGVQHLAVGPTPDRHKDLVEAIGRGAALVVLEGDGQPVLGGRDRRDLGLEQDLLVSGLDLLARRGLTMSLSAPGMIWSISSTTVTLDPSAS